MDLTANSAMSANVPSNVNAPLSYEDWVNNVYGPQTDNWNKGYGLISRFGNWLEGGADKSRDAYNAYLAMNNRLYELQNVNDSRKWQEYMASTQYQRMVKDLKAAGLNPYLALSGGISAAGTPSTYSPGSREETSARQMNSGLAAQGDSILAKVSTTALIVLGMVASRGMAAAGKAASEASRSAKLKAALAKALDY